MGRMSEAPRFLVTAGNTREMIDRVRDWGNIFTGNTGYAIAKALAEVGPVTLLTSNRAHAAEIAAGLATKHRITAATFTDHADLLAQLDGLMHRDPFSGVFMTAAVADYKPVRSYGVLDRRVNSDGTETWTVRDVQAGKIRSTHQRIAVLGEPTEKIVDLFRTKWNFRGLLVKFKLEVGISPESLIEIGQKSRAASGADYLVANTLDMVDGSAAGAYLLSNAGAEWIQRGELAASLAMLARALL
jgi:phosphopantothenoylcysteine synthetase/decarboxylase